jgi:uncharacterized protein (UPF0371 family)
MEKKQTTQVVRLKLSTLGRLKARGVMGDSYDDVINRLIDEHEKKQSNTAYKSNINNIVK